MHCLKTAIVFHAGTRGLDDQVVSAGGRVLGVTAGRMICAAALERAYAALNCISFDGMQYRSDIGHQALPAGNETGVCRSGR